MKENKTPNFGDTSEGIVRIAGGILVAIWSWSKRPIELRDSYPDVQEYVLKDVYFGLAILIAVVAVVSGIRRLNK